MTTTSYLDLAEHALRGFGGADISRRRATELLPFWAGRFGLTDADETEVLARFDAQSWPASIHHHDLVGETDPRQIKATSDRVDADEAQRRDRLVVERFSAGGESA